MAYQSTQLTELHTSIEEYLFLLVSHCGYSFEEVTAATNAIVMRSVALKLGREAAVDLCHETAQALIEAFPPAEGTMIGKPAMMGRC